jgi:hypothetical protein
MKRLVVLGLVLSTGTSIDVDSWSGLRNKINAECLPSQRCLFTLTTNVITADQQINITDGKDVKVMARDDFPVVLNAQRHCRFFNVVGSSLILEGPLTLKGGFTNGTGGAIYSTGSDPDVGSEVAKITSLQINGVTFDSNIAKM